MLNKLTDTQKQLLIGILDDKIDLLNEELDFSSEEDTIVALELVTDLRHAVAELINQ